MSHSTFILLRLIHIIVGVSWGGSIIFIATFLLPAIKASGPGGGAVMGNLTQVRRLPVYLIAGVLLTILSGAGLYWNDSAGFQEQWMSSGPGRTFAFGGWMAVIVAILGLVVNAPTSRRMGKLFAAINASGGLPSPEQTAEIQKLQTRLMYSMRAAAVLVLLAMASMAVARYVPS
jgi:uncharacterized membrane protein